MQFSRNQLIIFGAVGFIFIFLLFGVFDIIPVFRTAGPRVDLTFWGVENENSFDSLIKRYQSLYPNVSIKYIRFGSQDYERRLVNALAAGEGPDIFMFRSDWLMEHSLKLTPHLEDQMDVFKLRNLFPQVVEENFVLNNKVYALPLSIDTLALYYNRDIFDRRGVVSPPKTWSRFRDIVFDNKISAGFGGTSSTVPQAPDIISLLMLQSEVKMVSDDLKSAVFGLNRQALDVLNFYIQFTSPNESSLDAFSAGRLGMMIDYSAAKQYIKNKNPHLNFEVALVPQFNLDKPVSFASYYGLAVSRAIERSETRKREALNFVLFLTTNEEMAEHYALVSNRPPALRSLIERYIDHPEYGVFAKQALTARSWPQVDKEKVFSIFDDMIRLSRTKEFGPRRALEKAASEITSLMNR